MEGWGFHFLASDRPITIPGAAGLGARLPGAARADLLEWFPGRTVEDVFSQILSKELPLGQVRGPDHRFALLDDRPQNEYFLLSRLNRYARQRADD